MPKKHPEKQRQTLSWKDHRALKLVEDAQRQYERYQELREVTNVLGPQDTPDPAVPDWSTPLTLVFRGSA